MSHYNNPFRDIQSPSGGGTTASSTGQQPSDTGPLSLGTELDSSAAIWGSARVDSMPDTAWKKGQGAASSSGSPFAITSECWT